MSEVGTSAGVSVPGGQGSGAFGALDLNSIADLNSIGNYIVEDRAGTKWLRLNYDSGAATTAITDEMIGGPTDAVGEFVVADGKGVPNYGRFKVPCEDEWGIQRNFKASGTTVHKPLGSAAEFSGNYDDLLWEEGGTLIPKKSRLAQELRRAYFSIWRRYGPEGELPIYREGNLYNIYLKQTGKPQRLDALELNAKAGRNVEMVAAESEQPSSASQGFRRQAQSLTRRL